MPGCHPGSPSFRASPCPIGWLSCCSLQPMPWPSSHPALRRPLAHGVRSSIRSCPRRSARTFGYSAARSLDGSEPGVRDPATHLAGARAAWLRSMPLSDFAPHAVGLRAPHAVGLRARLTLAGLRARLTLSGSARASRFSTMRPTRAIGRSLVSRLLSLRARGSAHAGFRRPRVTPGAALEIARRIVRCPRRTTFRWR